MELQYDDVFEFGMYCRTPIAYKVEDFNYVALKEMGVDFAYVLQSTLSKMPKVLDNALSADVRIMFDGALTFYQSTNIDKYVEIVKNHPAFMGFYCVDEPHLYKASKDDHCYLGYAWEVLEYVKKRVPNKVYLINCLANYAKEEQLKYGIDGKDLPLPSNEFFEEYVRMVASTNTSVVCGDFYGCTRNKAIRDRWVDNARIVLKVAKEVGKPIWAYGKSGNRGSEEVPLYETLRFYVYFNMMWGAQCLIWFLYGDYKNTKGEIQYKNSPFKLDGSISKTYEILKDLKGEFKSVGSLFKGSEIEEVDYYDSHSRMPKWFKSISGELVVSRFQKGNRKFLAVFGYEGSSYRLASNVRNKVGKDLSVEVLKLRLNNSFEIEKGDIHIYLVG